MKSTKVLIPWWSGACLNCIGLSIHYTAYTTAASHMHASTLGRDQRRLDRLLLYVTKIIDLGQAGGGYVLWCQESPSCNQAFIPSGS